MTWTRWCWCRQCWLLMLVMLMWLYLSCPAKITWWASTSWPSSQARVASAKSLSFLKFLIFQLCHSYWPNISSENMGSSTKTQQFTSHGFRKSESLGVQDSGSPGVSGVSGVSGDSGVSESQTMNCNFAFDFYLCLHVKFHKFLFRVPIWLPGVPIIMCVFAARKHGSQ